MKTYGKNKPTSKLGSGTTYIATTVDSPEDHSEWSDIYSSKLKKSRTTALQDRGLASLNDDVNVIHSSAKTGSQKRPRCPLPERIKGGDSRDLQYLFESITSFHKNPVHSGGTLFVKVPDCWPDDNAVRFVNWLKCLGFEQAFLGTIAGYKIAKEMVIFSHFLLFSSVFSFPSSRFLMYNLLSLPRFDQSSLFSVS